METQPNSVWASTRLARLNPAFVRDLYIAAFGWQETSDDHTSLNQSRLMGFLSNRAQDYKHARWELAQRYGRFLEAAPSAAMQALFSIVEGECRTKHRNTPEVVPFTVAGIASGRFFVIPPSSRFCRMPCCRASMARRFSSIVLVNFVRTNTLHAFVTKPHCCHRFIAQEVHSQVIPAFISVRLVGPRPLRFSLGSPDVPAASVLAHQLYVAATRSNASVLHPRET